MLKFALKIIFRIVQPIGVVEQSSELGKRVQCDTGNRPRSRSREGIFVFKKPGRYNKRSLTRWYLVCYKSINLLFVMDFPVAARTPPSTKMHLAFRRLSELTQSQNDVVHQLST